MIETATSSPWDPSRDRVRATLTRLSQTGRLPVLPGVATSALAIARDPDGDVKDLAQVIKTDVGLTARVLRLANSAGCGRRREAETVQDAVMTLGLQRTCDVLVAIGVKGLYVGTGHHTARLWNHSLAVGVAAEELGRSTQVAAAGAAFLPGLLHDIGRIAFMLADPDGFEDIQRRMEAGEAPSTALERERYEFDHAQVGGILTEDWGLTPIQCDAVRAHHDPEYADVARKLAAIVNAADYLAYAIGHGTGARPPSDVGLSGFDLAPEEEGELIERVRDAYRAYRQITG
jgi:HD-like signal output (HDOD) protein